MGRPVTNKYKVPKRQWEAWSNAARRMFNRMYYTLRPSMQYAFIHLGAAPIPRQHWETTRWNVAWEAAQAVDAHRPARRIIPVVT
jgi:hypothetical protein